MSESTEEDVSLIRKISFDRLLLLVIILTAAVIRLWKFPEMQFMHDEVSAILRSTANSFSEVIYKQTTTDVHPVGIPVFLHYWVMLVGRNELLVRLPFILFGLLAIWYSYRIAEKWFNPTVALFTAAFLATLQCSTMYGQLARPYASGMFFAAAMCWYWTEFFFGERGKQNRAAVGFVLFAALCCYNHYFSLLFAAIVGATGFLFMNKENWKKYALCNLLVIVLFIPHVRILMAHLAFGNGGEESWLGKPQPDWLILFLKYLFHYSQMLGVLLLAVVGASFYFRATNISEKNRFRVIAFVWFVLGPLLAYLYSIVSTPVLQFSSFTFSLCFLFMLLFSLYGEMDKGLKAAFVGFIMLVNTYSLFAQRKHFPLFYKHPYEQMALAGNDAVKKFGKENVAAALSTMPGFVDFYFDKYGERFDYLLADYADMKGFSAYLEKQKGDYFIAGNLTGDMNELIREKYPYLLSKTEGFTYTIYCFSKKKPAEEVEEKVVFKDDLDLKHPSFYWSKPGQVKTDSLGKQSIWMDGNEEYGMSFTIQLPDVVYSRHSIVLASATITSPDSAADPVLVLDIHDSKGAIWWRGTDYINFNSTPGVPRTIHIAELLSGFDFKKHPYGEVKIYVWNRGKNRLKIENYKVRIVETNPRVYGLYEDL